MAPSKPVPALRCSVIIPSYGRAEALGRCLAALARQTRRPDEVLLITREEDKPTAAVVRNAMAELPLRTIDVREAGLVAASNLGLAAATGGILAFTDDDTEPWSDWLLRIE